MLRFLKDGCASVYIKFSYNCVNFNSARLGVKFLVKWAWQANGVGHAQQFRPCPGVAAVADEDDVVFSDQDRTEPLARPVWTGP